MHLRDLVARADNIAFVDEARVVGLLPGEHGVSGLRVIQNSVEQHVQAAAVMLATDGFAGNPDLVDTHLNHLGSPFYGGVSTATGDALDWVKPYDVPMRNMGAALRSGLVVVDHGTRVSPALPFVGAILVDNDGRRFVDEESKGYSGLARVLQNLPRERAVMVFDEHALAATQESEMMRTSIDAGAIRSASSAAELSNALGVDPVELMASLEPIPGRRRLSEPFRYAWVTHGLLASQGGLVVDILGRVLDREGLPVSGLSAGGGTACGLAGPTSDGYLSGNGLLSAFGFGWIVGERLAGRS